MLRALRKAEHREQEAVAAEKKTQQARDTRLNVINCNKMTQDVLRERETSEAARIQLDQVTALLPSHRFMTLRSAHCED
jgi:hypothetical protein